jgi:hypothetical protein
MKMRRISKPRKDDELTWQRRSLSHPSRAASLFKPGNRAAVGNKGYTLEARRHKRFITIGYINSLSEEIERTRSEMVKGKRVDIKELVTKEQMMIEALFKGFVVDRNPGIMRMVMEMIEGKSPQDINVIRKSYEITADMNLEQASRMYLESIKRTAEDEDDE